MDSFHESKMIFCKSVEKWGGEAILQLIFDVSSLAKYPDATLIVPCEWFSFAFF